MLKLITWYSQRLESHPLTTKSITSGFISGSGDAICQLIVHENNKKIMRNKGDDKTVNAKFHFDWLRTARFTFLGSVLIAPIVHHWYSFLNKKIPTQRINAVLKRTFYDQTICAPLIMPTFISSVMVLEGKKISDITYKMENEYFQTLVANWMLWVPAQVGIHFKTMNRWWLIFC
uniref:Uncharacterized protein n=1 Tax=Proboscia inermis TaxID=420281 RepID=A0A7S0BWE6_9STRA